MVEGIVILHLMRKGEVVKGLSTGIERKVLSFRGCMEESLRTTYLLLKQIKN
jgi:hypothetical protein